jgi:hypothetical protein
MVAMHENFYARNGVEGRDHIPALPFWMAIVRIVQFVLTLLVMILSAFASSVFGAGYWPGYGMSFFVFAWTLIFLGYIFVTPLWFPQFYLYWVHLGLECVTVVFWLSTFALLAEEAAAWDIVGDFFEIWPKGNEAIGATKGAAAMGAINWALFVFTLITFSIFLHKHRIARGATGFGMPQQRADVEKGANVTEQPVELQYVQQPQVATA